MRYAADGCFGWLPVGVASGRREEDHGVARAASPRSGTVAASVSTESGVESALANNEGDLS